MNTRVPIKTNKGRWGRDKTETYDRVAAHRLWGGFGLCGLDMKVRHHSLQTLLIFC